MENKFKVGDKVRIRKNLKAGGKYGDCYFVEKMLNFRGKEATIDRQAVTVHGFYLKENNYCWTPEMFEPVEKKRVIFRDNETILFKDGKKYVAKCCEGDTYDKEKGLLVCLAKAHGYTFNDLQEMLKGAECQRELVDKVKEVKRAAKVGDYVKVVKVVRSGYNEYKKGDILKIVKVEEEIFGTCYHYKDEPYKYLEEIEYIVLENYKPKGANNGN